MRKNIIMPLRMGPIFGPNLRGVTNLTTKGITGSWKYIWVGEVDTLNFIIFS